MNIEEQFNIVAQEYDRNRRKFISCFDEYYEKTTDFIVANIPAPKRILDLGAGTGLLSYYWYKHFPCSNFMLVDIADEMLKVAKDRFAGLNNICYNVSDYAKVLPKEEIDCIISALSIHHLENEQKADLFKRIYDKLPCDGIFVNYDQFCSNDESVKAWMDSYFEKQLENSGLTEEDLRLWRKRKLLDRECSVEEEIRFLRESGFEKVQLVYLNQKFAVIVAIKKKKFIVVWKRNKNRSRHSPR